MCLFPSVVLAALLTVACSEQPSPPAVESLADAERATSASSSASLASASLQASASHPGAASAIAPALPGRTAELVNPNDDTMVLLYYDLSGIRPPFDRWVEADTRVQMASAVDKAALRDAVRAELESAAAGVRNVGFIRVSMNAKLSDYDPTYGEFSVRALAPSSTLEFDALRHNVSLRFSNGRVAQIWRVPPAEAQIVRDKIGYRGVALDVLLRIASVQPGSAGGTIMTEVIEYEMRDAQRGQMIGRVQVAQQ